MATGRSPHVSPAGRTPTTGPTRSEPLHYLGHRRLSAQPLTASWRPEPEEFERAPAPTRPRGLAGLIANYGWRVYAIPVLVVLTVLVVVNAAKGGTDSASASGGGGAPVATEAPAQPIDTALATAALPPGDPFPQTGAGTWHVVPGNGPVVGHGPHLYHYQVAVEDGIDGAVYGGDDAFAKTADAVLADPRGWITSGAISLQRVDAHFSDPDFIVSLTTPNTDHRPDLCDFQIHYETSCWRPATKRVVINLARWVRGALAFSGDLGLYRQYAINHEVGHVFGNQHVGCTTDGGLAPVMMQQTFGVSDDYVYDLNQADPGNRTRVPRDGKVCKPNAWPYPRGAGNPADSLPN